MSHHDRPRLFLTFAEADLPAARRLAVQLRLSAVSPAVDYSVPSGPFGEQRSDLIRASLALRLRRCAATVCLLGDAAAADDWVRWTLAASRELRLPLVCAALQDTFAPAAAELLADLGAQLVPPSGDAVCYELFGAPDHERRDSLRAYELPLALAVRVLRQPAH